MDLEPVGAYDTVGSEVLAFEVRVDRHVKLGATSTDGGHEVDRGDSASFPDQLDCIGCDEQLHGVLSAVFLSAARLSAFSVPEPFQPASHSQKGV